MDRAWVFWRGSSRWALALWVITFCISSNKASLVQDLVGSRVCDASIGLIVGGGIQPSGQSVTVMGPIWSYVGMTAGKVGSYVDNTVCTSIVSIWLTRHLRSETEDLSWDWDFSEEVNCELDWLTRWAVVLRRAMWWGCERIESAKNIKWYARILWRGSAWMRHEAVYCRRIGVDNLVGEGGLKIGIVEILRWCSQWIDRWTGCWG